MNELALFAGAGGGILGGKLLGWRTVCAVEINEYARKVLMARQDDGSLEPFPIWDDVQTFNGTEWRGFVDVVSGGFPCTDISMAGRGAGIGGEESGLWREQARIIGEVRPSFVFIENSPALTFRGGVRVVADLAALGYDAEWGVLGAHHVSAPHKRDRIWILAYAGHMRGRNWPESGEPQPASTARRGKNVGHAKRSGLERAKTKPCARTHPRGQGNLASTTPPNVSGKPPSPWWQIEPDVGRVADGVAARMDRLKAIGNGQVPAVVRLAFNTLKP